MAAVFRRLSLLACAAVTASCAGSSPGAPTPAPPTTPAVAVTSGAAQTASASAGTSALFKIFGVVTDATSHGVLPNVTIQATDGSGVPKTASTDTAGAFEIAGLRGGAVTVVAANDAYLPLTTSLTLTTDSHLDLTLARRPPPAPVTIAFTDVGNGAAISTYNEGGYSLTASNASWVGATGYGHPAPFIEFRAAQGSTVVGELTITAFGDPFRFTSFDVYSSTTKIPYVVTAYRSGAVVYTLSSTVPNTFGGFATVTSGRADSIDVLTIDLTNPAAPCCANPVGVDTIVLAK